MREIDKYGVLKEKLQGICDENGLSWSIQNRNYPFLMVIKPLGGVDAQQTMLEGMDDPSGAGYISPDASLVFAYRDGEMSYKISETWTISENLFNKLKNLFKKMNFMWLQHFYRDVLVYGSITHDVPADDQEPENSDAEDEDTEDVFAEFLDEAEPAEIEEDAEDTTPEETGADE